MAAVSGAGGEAASLGDPTAEVPISLLATGSCRAPYSTCVVLRLSADMDGTFRKHRSG